MRISATTVIKARGGSAHVYSRCEVDAENMEEVFHRLITDGAILVDRLETRIVGGHREIIGRSPVVIGLSGVVMLQPIDIELKDAGA